MKRKEIIPEVERIQKNWQYNCLLKSEKAEMWECKDPESVRYAFMIAISRWGITVCGDLSTPLVFNVGKGYGMGFLAHSDVEYYMCSKLHANNRKEELNQERFEELILDRMISLIDNNYERGLRERLEEKYESVIDSKPYLEKLVLRMQGRESTSKRLERRMSTRKVKNVAEMWEDLNDIFLDFPHPDNIYSAGETLSELSDKLDYHDWWEHNISSVEYGVVFSLYMVNHAAKKILEKQGQAGWE